MTKHFDKKNLSVEEDIQVVEEVAVSTLKVSPDVNRELSLLTATAHDVLLEIGTEELPVDAIDSLAQSLGQGFMSACDQAGLTFGYLDYYGSPRRLAFLLHNVSASQPDQTTEHRGPKKEQAFDAEAQLTPAGLGFARRFGLSERSLRSLAALPAALLSEGIVCESSGYELYFSTTAKGEFLCIKQKTPGRITRELLPDLVGQALKQLPLKKSMRWGAHSFEFTRPVRWVTLLYGETEINVELFGLKASRATYGHRFHHPEAISLTRPSDYVETLQKIGHVYVDGQARRDFIKQQAKALVKDKADTEIAFEEDLLIEIANLVELPNVLLGEFDPRFLALPEEVLVSVMRTHQRCFCVRKAGKLAPYFIIVSNIKSARPERVIEGNKRVMQARLADAEFFFQTDSRRDLTSYLDDLKQVSFQEALGSLHDKSLRLSHLAEQVAQKIGLPDSTLAARAGLLAKSDLPTCLVQEFPELNGVMGFYYAKQQEEPDAVAIAIKEHYSPLMSQSAIPYSSLGKVLAIVDRLDTVVGLFGINQPPTGEKDPFALRRAALGLLRIIIEGSLDLDLRELIQWATAAYKVPLPNKNVEQDVFLFIVERLRAWYIDKDVNACVFKAVFAKQPTAPLDFHRRIEAVTQFYHLESAESLITAHKRVSHFLKKIELPVSRDQAAVMTIDDTLLTVPSEKALVSALNEKTPQVITLCEKRHYTEALLSLAELREVVDDFFDNVFILEKDDALRANRLAILTHLNRLFNQVADISLLRE